MSTNTTDQPPDDNRPTTDRWTLTRDIVVFQFKLVADGIRDFILVPVSLVVGLVSLLRSGPGPGSEFYDLLRYGRHTDHVINLFGAAQRVHPDEYDRDLPDIDEIVGKVETFVRDEYNSGKMTGQAKERIDHLLNALNRRRRA